MRIIGRPGYLGKRRNDVLLNCDLLYGKNKWDFVWKVNEYFFPLQGALLLYEDAYYNHFLKNPEDLEWLVKEASDVYDDSPTNVNSGLDYTKQETNMNHFQDIAVRRCLVRFGKWFKGERLIQLRPGKEGERLSPGVVKFHLPEIIEKPLLKGWWNDYSIECFYQSNKFLTIDECANFDPDDAHIWVVNSETPNIPLRDIKIKSVYLKFEHLPEAEKEKYMIKVARSTIIRPCILTSKKHIYAILPSDEDPKVFSTWKEAIKYLHAF